MLLGGIIEPPENVTVTFKDDLDKSFSEVKTVEYGGSCEFIEPPVHEGYTFDGWEIIGNNNGLQSVTKNTTCIAHYNEQSGGDSDIKTFVNGDGDLVIKGDSISNTMSGRAELTVQFSYSLNNESYTTFDIYEFGAGAGMKTDVRLADSAKKLIATDEDVSTTEFYRIGVFNDGESIGQKLYDRNIVPISISFHSLDGLFEDKTFEIKKV